MAPMLFESRVSAYAWIQRDDMVLLTLWEGAPARGVSPRWGLPGGGIEWGEQPDEALVREVFEETGYHIAPGEILGIGLLDVPPEQRLSGDTPLRLVRFLHRATIIGGELTHEIGGSTLRAAWFPVGELAGIPTEHTLDWATGVVRDE